ncbi:hypothetical protein LOZ51_001014 [Ophidiomyces ophidiicola]|nr:hypothetical protein LOZ55_000015 [Ophidiomyces ophidiicola]KAI1982728.1 hypothetical protein LOZ54_005282 [Ophidiomyces ophidiicola]KAI2000729.1 hypothetical protein LOZ51_001014 [Ophidiomyces ophidiicola]
MAFRAAWLVALFLFALLAQAIPAPLEARQAAVLPENDAFYVPPEGYEKEAPGTILRSRKVPQPIAAFGAFKINFNGTYQLLYRSNDNSGQPTATVTTVLVPHGADLTKVLSYQVAGDAASINCAPSYALQLSSDTGGLGGTIVTQMELLVMVAGLEKGWVVVVPDFEGPKGAFLANVRAGNAVLDGIRAALASTSTTGIDPKARVVMWGYSGGSLASGFAAEMQQAYAPELNIVGAALGGTVPAVGPVIDAINKSLFTGLIPGGIIGLGNEYPIIRAVVDDQLVNTTKAKFLKAEKQCFGANIVTYSMNDIYSYFKDPSLLKADFIQEILKFNSMGKTGPKIPVMIYKAKNDVISPLNETEAIFDTYCSQGSDVEMRIDQSGDHASTMITGAPQALIWLDERLRGIPFRKGCSRTTQLAGLLEPDAMKVLSLTLIRAFLNILGKPIGERLIG